jgi:hypothetical protein
VAQRTLVGEDREMATPGEQELATVLARAEGAAERIASAAGFIVDRVQRAGITSVVVSGGAAVVLATAGDFATVDIDLVTPEGDRLDAVLGDLGFQRPKAHQHIWANERLGITVQVAASYLTANSATDRVETPTGSVVSIWSLTDLTLDRLGQAVFWNARDRLGQAVALREAAGDDFDIERAQQRAADDGPATVAALDAFLRLYDSLPTTGTSDQDAYARGRDRFWLEIDDLGLRR